MSDPAHHPRAPRPGDTFPLTFDALDARGDATARLHLLVGPQATPRVFRVAVPGALPGERAEVRITRRHRDLLSGCVVRLEAPSAERVPPRCAHAHPWRLPGETCGGCSLQHIDAADQRRHKGNRLRALFEARGLDPAVVQAVVPPPDDWRYRNKMEFSFAAGEDGRPRVGLHPPGYRHDVLALRECLLVSTELSTWLGRVNDWLTGTGLEPFGPRTPDGWLRHVMTREGRRTDERMMELVTTAAPRAKLLGGEHAAEEVAETVVRRLADLGREAGAPFTSIWWTRHDAQRGRPTRLIERHLEGTTTLREILEVPGTAALDFAIHPRAFFQPNPAAAELIYALVLKESGLLEGDGARVALDLYCGTGTIALVLANHAERVVGMELQPDAVRNAEAGATRNGLANVSFLEGDVGTLLEQGAVASLQEEVDVIVVDPPRAGLQGEALAHVAAFAARRLVYVSCNPEALARDAALLRDRGWSLVRATPVDQFPQTAHVETVARFERQGA